MPKKSPPPPTPSPAPTPPADPPNAECEHSALICACGKDHPIIDDPAARYRKRLEFRAPAVLEQLERLTGKK